MISFRNHLLTLVAVFLALATGIVLGAGPLQATAHRQTSSDQQPEQSVAADSSEYGESFAAAVAPSLYGDRLKDREVAVVTFPGADSDLVDGLAKQIAAAGATVTGTWQLLPAAVLGSDKTLVDTLGRQLAQSLPKDAVQADASTYERLGQLLAMTLATTNEAGSGPWTRDASLTEALAGADLVAGPSSTDRKAPVVLVVLGNQPTGDGATTIVSGLVTGIARAARGTVLVSDVTAGEGQLSEIRAAIPDITTVDSADTAMGRTASILALARSIDTQGGAFGAFGSDGPVPLG